MTRNPASKKAQDPWVAAASPASHQEQVSAEGEHRRHAHLARRTRIEWIMTAVVLVAAVVLAILGSWPLAVLAVVFGIALGIGALSDERRRRAYADRRPSGRGD